MLYKNPILDGTNFGILDALSRDVGQPVSIRRLTAEIRDRGRRAHYANVYRRVQLLADRGILRLAEAGRARIVSLNLGSMRTLDFLGELELAREATFLAAHPEFEPLVADLDERLRAADAAGPTCLVQADENARLNRAELLLLLPLRAPVGLEAQRDALAILEGLGEAHGIRVDALALREDRWIELLASPVRNPVQEMAAHAIAIRDPKGLWSRLAAATARGLSLRFETTAVRPDRIAERDLVHNLSRFGYRELGTTAEAGTDLALETVVVAVLMGGDARRMAALPDLLASHRPDYAILCFLARKHGVADGLLDLIRTDRLRDDPAARPAEDLLRASGPWTGAGRRPTMADREAAVDGPR